MSVDDLLTALARLEAGLAEDEAIARAATPGARWVRDSGGEVFSVCGELGGHSRCDQHEPGVPNMCDDVPIGPDVDFDPGGHIAMQMVRQQPMRTLRDVAAIRRVVSDYNRAVSQMNDEVVSGRDLYSPAYFRAQALEAAIEALASIYAESTEEQP
ncbi:DUF6221 family protein [Nocardia sp. NPDC049149]|uniref:DUF6221 family protein n=1 Tax=Nocardia sp. NPDC049149 TaxID=3364315 RepID=UPI0037195AC3